MPGIEAGAKRLQVDALDAHIASGAVEVLQCAAFDRAELCPDGVHVALAWCGVGFYIALVGLGVLKDMSEGIELHAHLHCARQPAAGNEETAPDYMGRVAAALVVAAQADPFTIDVVLEVAPAVVDTGLAATHMVLAGCQGFVCQCGWGVGCEERLELFQGQFAALQWGGVRPHYQLSKIKAHVALRDMSFNQLAR